MRAACLLLVAALLCQPACAWREAALQRRSERSQRGELDRSREALEAGRYVLAIEYADSALRFRWPMPPVEAEAALLKGDALDGLGRYSEAAQLYRYVVAIHGGSEPAESASERLEALAARGVDVAPRDPDPTTVPLTRFQTSHIIFESPWLEQPVEIFYPFRAEAENLEGFVEVRLRSDGRGELAGYEVLASSHPIFEGAVVRALPRFRFVPEEMAKSDPPNTHTVVFTFRLREL